MSATATRPSLVNPRLWENRCSFYYKVFERALVLLKSKPSLPNEEPELTRELNFTTVTARRELDPEGRFDRPRFEAQNLPDPATNSIQNYEYKRPDIQWIHDDESVTDDRFREKAFVIECKRLGTPSSRNWILTQQYVLSGITRFSSSDFRYGSYMSEGAMIGFIQNMPLDDIHSEVNSYAKQICHPPLDLDAAGWQVGGVSSLDHEFTRTFANSPFRLRHLWLDIRGVPIRAVGGNAKRSTRKTNRGKKTP